MNYLLVIAATVLLAFEFALSKRYQMNEGTAVEAGLKFNTLSGLFSAVIFFVISGFNPGFSLFSLLMASLAACTPKDNGSSTEPPATGTTKDLSHLPTPEPYPPLATTAKPVIYLYPASPTNVRVTLDYDGKLTCTYPAYADSWNVTAHPDGTLHDASGMTYNYLYWEGVTDAEYEFSAGFCVPGEDTAAFLEDALDKLGFIRREANEFIVYWLPLMKAHPYNLIAFQTDAYTDHAKLSITPAPDTLIRVFMAWQPLEAAVSIAPQALSAPVREGFTVVEWGGAHIGTGAKK